MYLLKDEMQVPKQPLPVGQHVSFYFCSSRVTQFADLLSVIAKQSRLEVPNPNTHNLLMPSQLFRDCGGTWVRGLRAEWWVWCLLRKGEGGVKEESRRKEQEERTA